MEKDVVSAKTMAWMSEALDDLADPAQVSDRIAVARKGGTHGTGQRHFRSDARPPNIL